MKKILYLFSMLCIGYTASAQLSGTYTVYGTTPYAATIQDACDSLMLHGQSGAVVFDIRDNLTINEAVVLNAVVGNSITNTITFKSESNDSSKVYVFSNTGNTFSFNNVSYIKFNDITIGYNGPGARVVEGDNSHSFQFNNVSVAHTPLNGGWAIDIERDNGNNNFSFTNSNLASTSHGIYLYSSLNDITNPLISFSNITANGYGFQCYAEKSLTGLTIDESEITSSTEYAVYLEGSNTKIKNVTLFNSNFTAGTAVGTGGDAFYAWSDFIIEDVTITNSNFNSTNADGLYMGVDYTRLNNFNITTSKFVGLYNGLELNSGHTLSNITLNNDTVISNPTDDGSSSTDAAYFDGSSNVNNVTITNSFFQTQYNNGDDALEIYSGSSKVNNLSIKSSDFDGYSGLYVYGYAGISNCTLDSNTIYADGSETIYMEPYYGLGSNININYNNLTADDDGIYIYSDARIVDVTINQNIINSNSDGIYVEAEGGGLNNIVITNNIDTAEYEGVEILSDGTLENIIISNNNIVTYDGDGINVESDEASILNIEVNFNTIESYEDGIYFDSYVLQKNTVINNNVINAGNEGIYIDNSDGNVENVTIHNNIDTASTWGIDIDVYSAIRNVSIENNKVYTANFEGVYMYCEYSPIDSTTFKNNSIYAANSYGIYMESDYNAVNNTTFIDSNYVVSYSQALYIEGDYGGINGLTIDNSYFESTDNTGAEIIASYVYLNNVSIKNSTFVGDTTTLNYNYSGLYLESDDSDMENIEIVNNKVICDYYGIYIEADYGNAKNATIEHNDITASYYGINFDGIGDNSSISYNTINPFGLLGWGIYAYGQDGSSEGVTINSNTMNDLYYIGIDVQYSKDVTINNNYIRSTDAVSTSDYGISVYYVDGTTTVNGNKVLFDDGYVGIYFGSSNAQPSTPSIISNNFFSGCDYAIDVENADNVNVYHNSVSGNTNNTDQMIYFDGVNNINFMNNIVKSDSSTASGDIFYLSSFTNLMIDNNVYDFDSTNVSMTASETSLFDFQTATAYDAASFLAAPMFVNDTTDLHISCSNNALVAAPFIASVTTDVDGLIRNTTTTTFGAHEITPSGANILAATMTICKSGTIIPNLTGASYLWTPGNATTPTLTVTAAGTYYLQLTDYCGNVYNDSIVVTVDLPVASFTSVSGGSIFIFTNTSTNATSYMWDFGDGNTSTAVNPQHVYAGLDSTYTVTLIATNACGSDTITVIITTVDVPQNLETRGLNIYPNPVNENLTLDFGLLIGEDITINVFDIQGRVLITDQINGESGSFQKVINVNSLTHGIYFVRIATNDEVITKKIIKN